MSSLKILAVAGAVVAGATNLASAGDLPAALPLPSYDTPLRGTVDATSGIYVRGDVGVGITRIRKFTSDDYDTGIAGGFIEGLQFSGERDPNPVFVGVGIGYRFNNWLRADATIEYRTASSFGYTDRFNRPDLSPLSAQSNTYNGTLASTVGLFNAYADLGTFCQLGCITPFVGAGVGFVNHQVTGLTDQGIVSFPELAPGQTDFPTLGIYRNGSRTNLAWALHAGAAYNVTPNVTLELAYRYLNLGQAQSSAGTNTFNGSPLAAIKAKEIDSHDVKLGMRWALGGDCCAQPAPEPVYAPARPVVRKF